MSIRLRCLLPCLLLLAAPNALTGCGPVELEDEAALEDATLADAVTTLYPAGTRLRVAKDCYFRKGPGTAYPWFQLLKTGTVVLTVKAGGPTAGGYYEVSYGGKEGYVFGPYLHSTQPVLKWGLHPDASDALRQLGVPTWRIWQTIGSASASAGTHAQDGTYYGQPYTAAVDLRPDGMSDDDKRDLLRRMTRVGFVGWYRKPGYDGWPSGELAHFHIIYVGVPMKSSLHSQVRDWFDNHTGLAYSTYYDFVRWSDDDRAAIRRLYYEVQPEGNPVDSDKDGVFDITDNCRLVANHPQLDTDADGRGDACDGDMDNDEVPNARDNCPRDRNADQANTDGDGRGNVCDADDDNDRVPDETDNCRLTANPDQTDTDRDGRGDACVRDDDADGVNDGKDNCPTVANGGQTDSDGDGLGNACDPDDDNDGVPDANDNCRVRANPTQQDLDADGRGDGCDDDNDNDGLLDFEDNCRNDKNAGQKDTDADGVGDACDADLDGDTIANTTDNCPALANADQADFDSDLVGDACDDDFDNDGVKDPADNCQSSYNPSQADADKDGIGDVCEGSSGSD